MMMIDIHNLVAQALLTYFDEFDFNGAEIDTGFNDMFTDELVDAVADYATDRGEVDPNELFQFIDYCAGKCEWVNLKEQVSYELDEKMNDLKADGDDDDPVSVGLAEMELESQLDDADWDELTMYITALRNNDFATMLKSVPRWEEEANERGQEILNERYY